MDIVIDGEAKVQQARLYLKVTEENLKLRKALSQIQEERNSLKEFSAKLESECQDIKNSMSESATEAVALMQADVVEKLQVMESRIDFLNGQVISVTSQLSRKESEKQILMRHHERLLEDNARLKRELEHIYTESTSETIALIEEANSLRETISAQCDEVNDRAKIESHESTTELQRQVEIKNTMVNIVTISETTTNARVNKTAARCRVQSRGIATSLQRTSVETGQNNLRAQRSSASKGCPTGTSERCPRVNFAPAGRGQDTVPRNLSREPRAAQEVH